VDPIDGTKAFVREYPMFSTQIALMRRGEIVLGVSSAPVYGDLCFAERGCGAYLNGKSLQVSQIATLESAALSSGNMKTLATGAQWNWRNTARSWRRSAAFAAMVISCTIICWRAARSTQ
jgi:histidinol-phosphatase